MSRLSLLSASALTACVIATAASAQEARDFNIPPGPLRDGLNLYATQSDQQIFFTGDLVAGLTTPGLRGRYEPSAALDRLLSGTGLTWGQTRPGVLYVRRAQAAAVADATADQIAVVLDEIVVTGSLLKGSGTLASPVVTLDRDAIDARGVATVAEAVTSLPQNYAGTATPVVQLAGADTQGSNRVTATGVNLRGLGAASTLVLVNGRRMAGTGFRADFADISALPTLAVDHVDVLLDGASALYGADAVAGVVNVVMRPAFDGWETRLRASAGSGGGEDLMASVIGGRRWETGSVYFAYEHQTINPLNSRDCRYTADGDLRPFGGSDRRLTFSAPGNIVAYDAGSASYVSSYAIRPNASGVAEGPGDFIAGAANLQAPSYGIDLSPGVDRHAVYAAVRQAIGSRVELTADVRYNYREVDYAGPASIALMNVTSANPHFVSPNGSASHLIGYSFVGDLGNARQGATSASLGVSVGAAVEIGSGWSLDGYLALASEEGKAHVEDRVNTRFLNEALGTTADDPATIYRASVDGFFNPYGGGSANSAAVLDFIAGGFTRTRDRSNASSANLLAQGPLLTLPGGEVRIALGAQRRREAFEVSTLTLASTSAPVATSTPERTRTIDAVFAEARIPLVGSENAVRSIQRLELSLAGRFENYSDFGTTTNPKVGLVWMPTDGLSVRSSWGTSFRAGSLPQIHDNPAISATFFAREDGSRALALQLGGGNPDLGPETAETFTIGADFERGRRLRVGASYFDTRFEDRIARPVAENLAGVLTDPNLVNFVTFVRPAENAADLALVQSYIDRPEFNAAGMYPATNYAAIVDARWVNTGAVRVRGFDLSGQVSVEPSFGQVTFDAAASYVLEYETQSTPTAPVREVSGMVGFPVRLRSRLGATWMRGDFTAGIHWNHVSAYSDRTGIEIDAWNTADMRIGWSPSPDSATGVRLALSVQNLFDADPPFYNAPSGFGFDPGQANLLGRVVALQLTKRW